MNEPTPKSQTKNLTIGDRFFNDKNIYELKAKIVTEPKRRRWISIPCKKYGIPDWYTVKLWVNNYNPFGNDALMRSQKREKYTFEKKLFVVELYLSSKISYRNLAIQDRISICIRSS